MMGRSLIRGLGSDSQGVVTRRALSGATRSPRRSVEQRPAQSELKKEFTKAEPVQDPQLGYPGDWWESRRGTVQGSWSSYSLHIPLAPSHRRTFTGPLREDKPRSAPGVAEQCQAKKRKKNPPPKSTVTHHRNEASISSGSTHPGPLPYGLGRLRQRPKQV